METEIKNGTIDGNRVYTTAFGWVMRRKDHEPAPLTCEGTCGRVTMHEYSRALNTSHQPGMPASYHDFYKCQTCGHERMWG